MKTDASLIIWTQGIRAYGYGFTAILLGHLLASKGAPPLRVGLLLTCIVLGSALSSLVLMRYGDIWGRRRSYGWIYLLLGVVGFAVAIFPNPIILGILSLTGVLSTDANDNGPATTLEQAMLSGRRPSSHMPKIFGRYNGVAAIFGAFGALTQGLLSHFSWFESSFVGFLILVPIGFAGWVISRRLTSDVESRLAVDGKRERRTLKHSSARKRILDLSLLFSVDAAAGGLVTSSFLSYYLTTRYHVSASFLGYLFFAFAFLQSLSMFIAPWVARHLGLVWTMVSTHLVSNACLISAALCGNFLLATVFLLLRASLSQMDIPTRQALIIAAVPEEDRMAASAVTNAARYAIRPVAPFAGAALQQIAMATPLVLSGTMKVAYDFGILAWAKREGYLSRTID